MYKKVVYCLLLVVSCYVGRAQSASPVYVYFAFDQAELTTVSKNILDSLTDSLDLTDRIELHGHCDAVGGNGYNDLLSAKRVQSVRKYLLSIGWESQDILITQAHGENNPLNQNLSPDERRLNRRVEIKIIPGNNKVDKTLKDQLSDPAMKAGTNITLRNINFVGGLSQMLPESEPMLKELLDAMNAFPGLVIEIQGHICCHADSGDGIDLATGKENLSVMRAKAIRDYLVRESAIAPDRVFYRGFGHMSPIHPYPEKTEQEMIENRRVEIKIIRK